MHVPILALLRSSLVVVALAGASLLPAFAQENPATGAIASEALPGVSAETGAADEPGAALNASIQQIDDVPTDDAASDPGTSPLGDMKSEAEGLPPGVPADILPRNLSAWGMFLEADVVVKAVMIGLAFASVVTWTVWLAKGLELAGASSRARGALRAITSSRTLDEAIKTLNGRRGVGVLMVQAAEEEVALSAGVLDHTDGGGLKERIASRLSRINAAAGRRIGRGTGLLATIGATAPFMGLFGTVWGIMNAFIGISEAQTTNLAVVAPGIAEALLATAIGLIAAIPAVIIYNVFSRWIAGYRQILADAAAGVERLVSRDLDWRLLPGRVHERAQFLQPAGRA